MANRAQRRAEAKNNSLSEKSKVHTKAPYEYKGAKLVILLLIFGFIGVTLVGLIIIFNTILSR